MSTRSSPAKGHASYRVSTAAASTTPVRHARRASPERTASTASQADRAVAAISSGSVIGVDWR